MTARLPEPPVLSDSGMDLLGRKHIATSGIHGGRIALCAALVAAVGFGSYIVRRDEPRPVPEALASTAVLGGMPPTKEDGYGSLATTKRPELPVPRAEPAPPIPAAPAKQANGGSKESLRERALAAGIGGWSSDHNPAPMLGDGIENEPGAGSMAAVPSPAAGVPVPGTDVSVKGFQQIKGACIVLPATPLHAVTLNTVVTERGGIVTALLTRDVWDAAFSCLAVPAGSIMTIEYGTSVTRGQKRIEVRNPVIMRPWPRQDAVQPAAMTADAQGASGLPGAVEVPWFRTGLLVAASTAVDLAAAALSEGGSIFGTILGRNIDSPLDRAAKDLLERAPVIRLDAGEPITLILRGAIQADEFRT